MKFPIFAYQSRGFEAPVPSSRSCCLSGPLEGSATSPDHGTSAEGCPDSLQTGGGEMRMHSLTIALSPVLWYQYNLYTTGEIRAFMYQ